MALALSHGTNDAPKTMGMIAMAVVATSYVTEFQAPWWVITLSAGAIALGTLAGGGRLIKTLGGKFYRIRPVHAFGSQLTLASIILGAALLGGPVGVSQDVPGPRVCLIPEDPVAGQVDTRRLPYAHHVAVLPTFSLRETAHGLDPLHAPAEGHTLTVVDLRPVDPEDL